MQVKSTSVAALFAAIAVRTFGNRSGLVFKIDKSQCIFAESAIFEKMNDSLKSAILIESLDAFFAMFRYLNGFEQFLCFHMSLLRHGCFRWQMCGALDL